MVVPWKNKRIKMGLYVKIILLRKKVEEKTEKYVKTI